ncbi:MAG: hypothetical protein HY738_16005, partial [Bacteroidia bacterium]|nr:hypothetical protein [Bacteroidia bacterium]
MLIDYFCFSFSKKFLCSPSPKIYCYTFYQLVFLHDNLSHCIPDFSISETDVKGFDKSQAGKTIVLTLPAGFEFNTTAAHTVTYDAGMDITSLTGPVVTVTTITITVTTDASDNSMDAIHFNNFQIRATAAGSGDLLRSGGTFKIDGSTTNPTDTESLGNLFSAPAMEVTSSNIYQNETNPVQIDCEFYEILEFELNISNTCPAAVTQFVFNTTGDPGYSQNPATNISNATVYFTDTARGFTIDNQFGTVANPNGAFTINGSQTLSEGAGTYYFYLAYYISSGATAAEKVDASLTSFTFNSTTYSNTGTPNPAGTRTIEDNCAASCSCSPGTKTFTVDLTDNPDQQWTLLNTKREGLCCGVLDPLKCIKFIVLLNPLTEQLTFSVFPEPGPGASSFFVNCTDEYEVKTDSICVVGDETVCITYCKSGSEPGDYTITVGRKTEAGSDITLNAGCTDFISIKGILESSIVWTSVYPGAQGAYNSYLSCTFGCDTTYVTAPDPLPGIEYIDYQVSATSLGCETGISKDTVRVYFVGSSLSVAIDPQEPAICYGSDPYGKTLTANPTGGASPYTYLWSTGAVTQSIFANIVGDYWVRVWDTTNCDYVADTVTLTEFSLPIEADAGVDQTVCASSPTVTLAGQLQEATGGEWSGGSGIFVINNEQLDAQYTPSAGEMAAGEVTLTLTTTEGLKGCPPDDDEMTIYITSNPTVNAGTDKAICYGKTVTIGGSPTASGGTTPYTYSWNNGASLSSTSVANPVSSATSTTTYTVTVTDANGCSGTDNIIVTVNTLPAATATNNSPVCVGKTLTLTGGPGAMTTYSWSGPDSYSNATQSPTVSGSATTAMAGVYTITVTDGNGCTDTETTTVTVNTLPLATATSNSPVCVGKPLTLTGGPGGMTTYSWSGPDSYSNTTQSPTVSSSATTAMAGVYTITVTDGN